MSFPTEYKQTDEGCSLSFAASTASLADLGAFIRDSCSKNPKVVLIELAVSEVVMNAIKHGQAKSCLVSVSEDTDHYKVIVKDDGAPFDSVNADAKPMGELREGSYGIGFIKETAKELQYAYVDGWNQLTLLFGSSS